ncbi:MAG: hypothetical protein JXD22_15760 [Sedimentisphaerales bacterium]|nr:hypothetical protein [Sedimentisphaerales bacterium]
MTKWLWYANAAIVFIAILVLIIGFSQLGDPAEKTKSDKNSTGRPDKTNSSDSSDLSINTNLDSPLMAATRRYSKRWEPPRGSLKVTLTPPELLETDPKAQWRLNNGTWFESSHTLEKILTGPYTVEFKPITGWIAPANQTVTIEKKKLTEIQAEYKIPPPPPPVGSIVIKIEPAEVLPAKPQWRLAGKDWQDSGATLTDIPVGTQNIEFKPLTEWNHPEPLTVEVAKDETIEATGTYSLKPRGNVTVTIEPEEVRKLAKWTIANNPPQTSGETISLLTGTYECNLTAVNDWITPQKLSLEVIEDQDTQATATYVRKPKGSIIVFISPAEAGTYKTKWRVDGGVWQEPNTLLDNIDIGKHNVNFNDIPGWNQPQPVAVEVLKDQTIRISALYTVKKPPAPTFKLLGTIAIGENFGYATVQLPDQTDPNTVAVGYTLGPYRVSRIADGFMEVTRQGYKYRLEVPEPKEIISETPPPDEKTNPPADAKEPPQANQPPNNKSANRPPVSSRDRSRAELERRKDLERRRLEKEMERRNMDDKLRKK